MSLREKSLPQQPLSVASTKNLTVLCLLTSPALPIQMCCVLASIFSTVNLRVLQIPPELISLHLVLAPVLSIGVVVLAQTVNRRLLELTSAIRLLHVFTLCLSLGATLVLIVNLKVLADWRLRIENTTQVTYENTSNPNYKEQLISDFVPTTIKNQQKVTFQSDISSSSESTIGDIHSTCSSMSDNSTFCALKVISLSNFQMIALVGYTIMTSSLSAGQLLISQVAEVCVGERQVKLVRLETSTASIGACVISFLGALDLSFTLYPSSEVISSLIGHVCILTCLTLTFLIVCTIISFSAWRCVICARRHRRDSRGYANEIFATQGRRSTRTAQEIFDECASLLGHTTSEFKHDENIHPRNLPTEHQYENSCSISHSEMFTNNPASSSNRLEVTSPRSRHIPAIYSRKKNTKKKIVPNGKHFLKVLLVSFFLSGPLVAVEYNSAMYLSLAHSDEQEGGIDQTYRLSARVASLGIMMSYLLFIAIGYLSQVIPHKLGWKPLTVGASLSTLALSLALSVSHSVVLYFSTTCGLGLLRVVVTGWTLSELSHFAQVDNSYAYTTTLWSMVPLHLGVSSAVLLPLLSMYGFYQAVMIFSSVSAGLGCLLLLVAF